jgi:integrase
VVPIDQPTICVTSHGTPWTESGLRASFFKLIRKLEADGKVKPGLTFHGLRHTVGRLIIEAGGTARDVQILLDDRSEAMGKLYSEEHKRKRLATAAVKKLERNERRNLSNRRDKSV